jgi:hypothetical protein
MQYAFSPFHPLPSPTEQEYYSYDVENAERLPPPLLNPSPHILLHTWSLSPTYLQTFGP